MDTMIQSYMEETEDMLQKAEECMISLEKEYSADDVNELFRIAHTIKGSSQMVGYVDIGNLMHKIEDMLDCTRNGSIVFDQSIVSLCFEGLDTVKKLLQNKKEPGSAEFLSGLDGATSRLNETIDVFIRVNKKEEKAVTPEPELGIISSLLSKHSKGKRKYFITFFIEEDAPMVSPVIMIILNSLENVGTLLYSSLDDKYFSESSSENEMRNYDIIISTDIHEAELYTYFALFYIEKINIVELSRCKVAANDFSFIDSDDDALYEVILKTFIKLYKIVSSLSKEFKIGKKDIDILNSFNCQAVNAFAKMKGKKLIDNFAADFNELYSNVIKIYDGQVDIDEELCSDIQTKALGLMQRAYDYTKGKHVFSVFKAESNSFIGKLRGFIEMLNKSSTLVFLIDLSKLTILNENEVKDLIEIKKQIESHDIEIAIIAKGPYSRKIINIFDSIKQVEDFHVFATQLDAVIDSDDCIQRISKRVKDVQHE